jgi:hypothetical protein
MRGGMEGTSGTTGQVPGDTEVPFIAYDINETWNSKKYKEFMKKKEESKDKRIKERYDRYIKKYEEMCKEEYLRENKQFLKMKSHGMTTKEYLENTQKAGELKISLEEYLNLKQKAERTKMTVEDFLSLQESLDTSQTGTSSQNPQLQPGYDSTIVE